MRNIRIILISLFCVVLFVNQGKAQSISQILEKAKESIYGSSESSRVKFTSTYSYGKEQNIINGEMILQDENFRLTYDNIVATFSKGLLSYFDKNQNTLNFSEPSKDELIQINPFYFFNNEVKGFKITKDAPTKTSEILVFKPVSNNNIEYIKATFARKQGFPTNIVFNGKDRSTITIKIQSVERIKPHPISFFELKTSQYPNAEVVDLR